MGVKILLIGFSLLVLALLTSCIYEQPAQVKSVTYVVEEPQLIVFIVEEPQPQVFVFEHKDPNAWLQDTKQKRFELNTLRAIREDDDELEEFEIRTKLKNVRRSIDGEVIFGFDEDLDNPDFKEVE